MTSKTSDVKSCRRPNSTEHVTSSSRLSAMTVDPSNIDQSWRAWRRKMTNPVDSKVTPDDSWLDVPLLFLLIDECQVPPDRDFRSDAPIERIIQLQMPIVRKFNNLKPMTLTVTLNRGSCYSPPSVSREVKGDEQLSVSHRVKGRFYHTSVSQGI